MNAFVVFLLSLIFTFIDARVVMLLLIWFIVPIFGLNMLPYVFALGLMLTVHYLIHKVDINVNFKFDDVNFNEYFKMRVIRIVIFLAFGFILTYFIPVVG